MIAPTAGITGRRRWFAVHPRRALVVPAVRPLPADGQVVRLAVDGLVCGLCAARTASALASLPEVQEARVDLATGIATLRPAPGATVDAAEAGRAVARVVVGMRLRRLLQSLGQWVMERRGA